VAIRLDYSPVLGLEIAHVLSRLAFFFSFRLWCKRQSRLLDAVDKELRRIIGPRPARVSKAA